MLVADDPSRILLLGCASAQRVAPLVSSTGEERRHYVTEFIRLLQRRHMSNSFDSVKDGVWDVLRQKAGSVPADVIVLTQHDERGDLDGLQRAVHAEKRFALAQHLREGMSQSDERCCANKTRHMPTITPAAIGIGLEKFAAQHVREQFVPARALRKIDPPARQPLDSPSVVRARSDVGENEMRNPLGPGRGKRKCRTSSQGKSDDRDLLVTKRIDDAGEIAGKMRARITAGVIGGFALTVAALVVSEDRVATGQSSSLVKPHTLSACQSVHEDHGPAAARAAVGKLDIADANAARGISHACPCG